MQVPLLDLKAQYAAIRPKVEAAIAEVMESQHFILGPKVEECEKVVARYSNCAFGIGVSSGSDALLACLMAENIGPGDEVITTPYTFFATVGAIVRVGATPVFIDIEPDTYNFDVSQLAAAVTSRTRAIMPVHLYGQMADMDTVMAVAKQHGLVVIEDAAQAIGSERDGKRAGSIGHYGCFSFFPSKNLGCAGDGGMIVTNDAQRAEKLKVVRGHGSKPKYHHKVVGGNFRLDALQAAIVTAKLAYLDEWTAGRQRNAATYDKLFSAAGLTSSGSDSFTPKVVTNRHIFNQYVIRVSRRDALQAYLREKGVGTEVYYPVPMHSQECFAQLGYKQGDFPESERAANQTLALPIYPELTEAQLRYVAGCVSDFVKTEHSNSELATSGAAVRG